MGAENRDIRQKLEPFRRRWWMIALIVVAIAGVTYYHYRGQHPGYQASATVFVRSAGATTIAGTDPETDPARRLQNEATLLQSPEVAAAVAKRIHYKGDPRELLSVIAVTPSANSDFVTITATSQDPAIAQTVANGFASQFETLNETQTRAAIAAQVANLKAQLDQIPRTVANAGSRANLETELQNLQLSEASPPPVQIVNRATVPTGSNTPSPARNAVFGGVLGLVLACLLVQALQVFDRRLRDPVVEAEYGLPLLASVPFTRRAYAATRSGSQVPVAMMEGVRGLRTMLDHGAGSGEPPRTVLLTSATSGEGKSTLIKSLALGYFEGARRVLVIDADLRRPVLHELFDAPLVPGLSDVLRSAITLSEAVQEVQPGELEPAFNQAVLTDDSMTEATSRDLAVRPALDRYDPSHGQRPGAPILHVLTCGSGTSDPAALLGSEAFASLLAEAAATYDIVLIDSTPVLAVSDAIPVATQVDAVVVVARSEFTTRDAAQRCRQALERVHGVKLVGVVANGVRDIEHQRPYYLKTG